MSNFLADINAEERLALEQKLSELRRGATAVVVAEAPIEESVADVEFVDAQEAVSDDHQWRKALAIVAFALSTGFHSSGIAEKIIKAMREEGLEEQVRVFELVWMKTRSEWMQSFMG